MRRNRFAEAESFKQNGRMKSQREEYIFRLWESPRWKRYFWYFRGQQYLRRFPPPSYVCILLNAVCAPGGEKRKREDIRKNERETNSLEGSWNSPSQAAKRKTSSSFTVRIRASVYASLKPPHEFQRGLMSSCRQQVFLLVRFCICIPAFQGIWIYVYEHEDDSVVSRDDHELFCIDELQETSRISADIRSRTIRRFQVRSLKRLPTVRNSW